MAPATPRLRILSVGGNAVSAFLSWRLQATNACDVTLVWKSGFESVAQYGISFKSKIFGNERFKPRQVVRTPEEAAHVSKNPFDYVLLCVKALPDVYDLASVIESVVAPQHTCILINTTNCIGVESYLESRFPTNVVLSLVSGAEVLQLGGSEFEHIGATDIWVGPANKNAAIPASIQSDMAEALAMTLSSGQVDCTVSLNIRQQQYERMIGPIAFHPASVIFETPSHSELLEKVGVRTMITGVIDELLDIAVAQGCTFPSDFKERTMQSMIAPTEQNSFMYQDFAAKRPMEIETYLGSPMKLAQEAGVPAPRIETLYAMLHHTNIVNQTRPAPTAVTTPQQPPPPPRSYSSHTPRPMMNGAPNGYPPKGPMPPRGSRAPSMNGAPPPGMRRPPTHNGYPPRMPNGAGYHRGPPSIARRPSFEQNDLEEFSHVMLYDTVPEGDVAENGSIYGGPGDDVGYRERELALRQKELELRERELHMRRGPRSRAGDAFDEDDGEDYFDPMSAPPMPHINPDELDMMSVTSRRNRKAPSASQLRQNPEMGGGPPRARHNFSRPGANRNRTSARLAQDMPGLHDSIMQNPLMGYSSDRYGGVDRSNLNESRTNSLTAARLDELQQGNGYGGYPPMSRRTSHSPGNPLSPRPGGPQRPSPNGYPNGQMNGQMNGRPSPPAMRQPVPRHPPGHGNAVAPQQVEQHAGVSNLYPPKSGPQVRSLTGSASASAGSGDSAHVESTDPSAHSSSSSLPPRPPIGVR
ncbi:MAG: hypothetical protein M1820_002467 [Bogoriella megaspora]|nr:MAG: hypothetical protein M1820_002467 [Bogoriella megaspora]